MGLGRKEYVPSPYKTAFVRSRYSDEESEGVLGEDEAARPRFNVRRASTQCRQIDGYVSFANVEGLGAPPETDSDSEEDRGRGGRGGVTEWVRWTKRRLLGENEGVVV